MPSREPYSQTPDASDITVIDEDAGNIGAIRIDDSEDVDIVTLFSDNSQEFSASCESGQGLDNDNWKLVGIERGATFGEDSLTFDKITKDSSLGIEDIADASLGSITKDGTFPFTKSKCAGLAEASAKKEHEKNQNSRWLCEMHGDADYASIFIGYTSHPWEEAGNIRYGFTLHKGMYKYYNDPSYTRFYIKNIGSKPSTSAGGVPKISADWVWLEHSVSLFANTYQAIQITEQKIVINADYAATDGYHKILINGFSNDDARGGKANTPCSRPTQQLTSDCNDTTDSVASDKITANGARHSCVAKTLELLPASMIPEMAPGISKPEDSGMMKVGIR